MLKKGLEYLNNLCYSIFRIVRRIIEKRCIEMKNGIFDAKDLARYITAKYWEYTEHDREITPIKLQKSLYFVFAIWGGLVEKSKNDFAEFKIEESKYLFFNDIEAWVYGPVVPDVYRAKIELEDLEEAEKIFLDKNSIIKETIDDILNDIFEIGDFKLVSISHSDLCWKNNFNVNDISHDRVMNKDAIIKEYATRESL